MKKQARLVRGLMTSAFLLLPLVLAGADALAEETPVIVNVGEATALAPIGLVEFAFDRTFAGETLEQSVTLCDAFLQAAPVEIRGSELQPTDLQATPPLVESACQVKARITVQFSMTAFNTPQTGRVQFAALCDKMNALAGTMNATLVGPVFLAANAEAAEAEAVGRATENAFPNAEAIAVAVKSSIYAIQKVEVLDVGWEQCPEKQAGDTPQMGCTARVQVTYLLSAQ